MMPTPKLARIYVDGKPSNKVDAPWAIQQKIAKQMSVNGRRVEVHSPIYPGTAYCKNCMKMHVKPYTTVHEGYEFYRCVCGQINWVR